MKILLVFLLLAAPLCLNAEEITLVRHAKRVAPATIQSNYIVRANDSLNKILTNIYKAKPKDMPALYKAFRELNPNIKNLNIIVPGQKILIPSLSPIQSGKKIVSTLSSLNTYTLKKGEHLAMMLRRDYGLSDVRIFKEYLPKIKELNPDIKNLNNVYPGQKIILPEELSNKNPAQTAPKKTEQTTDSEKYDMPEKKELAPVATEPTPAAAEPVKINTIEESVMKKEEDKKEAVQETPAPTQPIEATKEKPDSDAEAKAAKTETMQTAKPVQTAIVEPEKKTEQKIKLNQTTPIPAKGSTPLPIVGNLFSKNRPPASMQVPVTGKVETINISDAQNNASYLVKNTITDAYRLMGEGVRDAGVYYMPVTNGNISINAEQIPVLELSTGRKVFLDVDQKIKPEEKRIIERLFPSYRIISGSKGNIDILLDRALAASGFYSVNKDGAILLGDAEKLKIKGKWIIYKDKTRSSVYVINFLSSSETKTPGEIKKYALKSGVELIEIGGTANKEGISAGTSLDLDRNIERLFEFFNISYVKDKEISLSSGNVLNLSYNAKILNANVIFTDYMPETDILLLLKQKGYTVIDTATADISVVFRALRKEFIGPPVKINVSGNRIRVELPGIKSGNTIVLDSDDIDKGLMEYIQKIGFKVIVW